MFLLKLELFDANWKMNTNALFTKVSTTEIASYWHNESLSSCVQRRPNTGGVFVTQRRKQEVRSCKSKWLGIWKVEICKVPHLQGDTKLAEQYLQMFLFNGTNKE